MCLLALLIEGLSSGEKDILKERRSGVVFKVDHPYKISNLINLNLARQFSHTRSRLPTWILTYCGQRAGQLLIDLENNPLLRIAIREEYDEGCDACPLLNRNPVYRRNMDERLKHAENEYFSTGTLAAFENYRHQRQRAGNPVPPNDCGHIYANILTQILPEGIIATFDEANWSGYPENASKVWIEIFWELDVFKYTTTYNEPCIRDVVQLLIDTSNNIFEFNPDVRHEEFGFFSAPDWVLERETQTWEILRAELNAASLIEGKINWAPPPTEDQPWHSYRDYPYLDQ